jgi:hypothetical protein
MSRLPHQAVPSDPIEEDMPVCAVAHAESRDQAFPTALEATDADPITEIPILHLDDLFEGQCLDQTARWKSAARIHDPTWGYDKNGILTHRAPSGEVEVFIPHALRRHGPHAIILPVAGDGSNLRRGVISGDTDNSFANPTTDLPPDGGLKPKFTHPKLRLLTRGQVRPASGAPRRA